MSNLAGSNPSPNDAAAAAAVLLLANYSFDRGRYTPSELVERWLSDYPAKWICLAVIEALYQGRYKAVSVEQILTMWARRKQPRYHFNSEFERLICSKLPRNLTQQYFPSAEDASATEREQESKSSAISAETIDNRTTAAEIRIDVESPSVGGSGESGKPSATELWISRIGPIDQFIPEDIDPDFYQKLKALLESVAQSKSVRSRQDRE
jgi:hypothetical protein